MKTPLPAHLVSSISTIRWPLIPNATPMYYEPLSSLKQLRQTSNSFFKDDDKKYDPSSLFPLLQDLDETINSLTIPNDKNDSNLNKHYVTISLALLCLGHGLADEAHDLITPLSWPEDTYFGGISLCTQTSDEVISLASYTHSLLHRREGFANGEFGMIGYQNANYWSNAARNSKGSNIIPYGRISTHIVNIANDFGEEAINWCQEHIIDASDSMNDKIYHWDPRALHELCARTSRDEGSTHMVDQLRLFAELSAEIELRLLLQCSLTQAGYACDDLLLRDNEQSAQGIVATTSILDDKHHIHDLEDGDTNTLTQTNIINHNLALATANKVSSAHLNAFQSSNFVTIRNVIKVISDNNHDLDSEFLSVTSGLACRLLGSPACRIKVYERNRKETTVKVEANSIVILMPKNEKELNNVMSTKLGSTFCGGGPLNIGDATAIMNYDDNFIGDRSNEGVFTFVPCSSTDVHAIFVDTFHGTRGETPTTVLQWSKGTIFETDR